jgi:hypothetical protein
MSATKTERISNFTAGLMVIVALLFDLVGIIPLVNILSQFTALLIFGLWFFFLGVGFINPQRFAAALISTVIELIPFVSILPGLTVAVIICIVTVRTEDKLRSALIPQTSK